MSKVEALIKDLKDTFPKVERHLPQMRLREAFAGQQMAALVSKDNYTSVKEEADWLAYNAVLLADALIKELEKEEE